MTYRSNNRIHKFDDSLKEKKKTKIVEISKYTATYVEPKKTMYL